ncbi:ThioredoxinT [Drosophila ananassae]|uniref:ThioredoxinT n=1 Tax=Drosophila ananassae TaxID=7217 RepID=B3MRQ9_DROAN|nr:thioredoxin-T [Drosophila ananassae]EDV34464.1 ThioredoxinT [Drosophila ananassae]
MVYLVRSKDDLDQQLAQAQDKLVVIDFYANWCGPCKVIAPKLEELAQLYSDRAVVLKVNVDENEEITVEYNVTSMPTFVFIKGGEVVELFVGGNSDKLAKSMEKYVGEVVENPDQSIRGHSSSHLGGGASLNDSEVDSISAGPSATSGNSCDVGICDLGDRDPGRAVPEAKGAALEN